jgi:DNA (cytosine-5)-methyltransferase 1
VNYYNEYDPKAAAWLRELIRSGEIPAGDVDERSILDIQPHELAGYTQHHFFAGIGGWSLALRIAGWPDDRPVRTGSCPCQPFSAAGKQLGTKDERHLWPVFRDLITFGEPTETFGEQVASALGREWLAGIRADLEGLGYAVGAADLCAAGAGAPHIRQRLFWVAHPGHKSTRGRSRSSQAEGGWPLGDASRRRIAGRLANLHGERCAERAERDSEPNGCGQQASHRDNAMRCGGAGGLEHAESDGRQQRRAESGGRRTAGGCSTLGLGDPDQPGPQGWDERGDRAHEWAPWSASVALACTDGKARRTEPGTFPLAHGIPGRVGLLRGYGNAIVPQVAAHFVTAYLEATNQTPNKKDQTIPGRTP